MRYGHYPPPAAGRNLLAELADAREVNDRLSAVNRLLDRAVLTLQHQLTETLLPRELRCGHCRRYQPLGAFSFDRARKSGRRGWCRECDALRWLVRIAAIRSARVEYNTSVGISGTKTDTMLASPPLLIPAVGSLRLEDQLQ